MQRENEVRRGIVTVGMLSVAPAPRTTLKPSPRHGPADTKPFIGDVYNETAGVVRRARPNAPSAASAEGQPQGERPGSTAALRDGSRQLQQGGVAGLRSRRCVPPWPAAAAPPSGIGRGLTRHRLLQKRSKPSLTSILSPCAGLSNRPPGAASSLSSGQGIEEGEHAAVCASNDAPQGSLCLYVMLLTISPPCMPALLPLPACHPRR